MKRATMLLRKSAGDLVDTSRGNSGSAEGEIIEEHEELEEAEREGKEGVHSLL